MFSLCNSMRFNASLMWTILILTGVCTVLHNASAMEVLRVPSEFSTIQQAIDEAQPGDIIQVSKGVFYENIDINNKSGIRLHGRKTILDGAGVGNTGVGVSIKNSDHIRVQGFIVEGFEAGIILEDTSDSQIHNVETRFNDSDTSTLRDGLQLVASHHNLISNVYSHHNGHNGITLKKDALAVKGSSNNRLIRNHTVDNGKNPIVAAVFGGCGIQLISSGNHDNTIIANKALRNGWGIQIGGGSNNNEVLQNRSHENQRAGIVVLDSGHDNFIGQNNALGNGLGNVLPSEGFDLFDQGTLDNVWRNNRGTSNF